MHLNAIKTYSIFILSIALNNDQKDLSTADTYEFLGEKCLSFWLSPIAVEIYKPKKYK